MSRDHHHAEQRLFRARRGLILAVAVLVLLAPLAGGVEDVHSYPSLAPGLRFYGELMMAFVLTGFLPGLVVNAALAVLFPSWRFLRFALPLVAALTLIGWAAWFSVFFGSGGKSSSYPLSAMRWSLVAAGPLGIVSATASIFLLARARWRAVLRS